MNNYILTCCIFIFSALYISNSYAADSALDEGIPSSVNKAKSKLPPFGSNLFVGNSASLENTSTLDPGYIIGPGDKVSFHAWGAIQADETITVDSQGNLFLPEIGAVQVAGVTANELPSLINKKLKSVYKSGVEVYINLLTTTAATVFVTGPVYRPGQYTGTQASSILSYLKKAGGILPNEGSYRQIQIIRKSKPIANVDLYSFLRWGVLPKIRFKDGDTILVTPMKATISVLGDTRGNYQFELNNKVNTGKSIIEIAKPSPSSTSVAVSGTRSNQEWSNYTSLSQFSKTQVYDGDTVRFVTDNPSRTIDISVEGSHLGNSFFAIKKGARLEELLDYIAVAPEEADTDNIYIKRKSLAKRQKKSLEDSINRLERSLLTSPAKTSSVASIRQQESTLLNSFIKSARSVIPEGKVAVSQNGRIANILLEDGDIIVIPLKTDIVIISGEVNLPRSIVFTANNSILDYVKRAGGFTSRADKDKFVIRKANGEISDSGLVMPGDELVILPKVDPKTFQFAKDIISIIFQIAATSSAVGII